MHTGLVIIHKTLATVKQSCGQLDKPHKWA